MVPKTRQHNMSLRSVSLEPMLMNHIHKSCRRFTHMDMVCLFHTPSQGQSKTLFLGEGSAVWRHPPRAVTHSSKSTSVRRELSSSIESSSAEWSFSLGDSGTSTYEVPPSLRQELFAHFGVEGLASTFFTQIAQMAALEALAVQDFHAHGNGN